MRKGFLIQNVLLGTSALVIVGSQLMPERDHTGPVLNAAANFVKGVDSTSLLATPTVTATADGEVEGVVQSAVNAFSGIVRGLSRPEALETAFKSYFAYKTAHPNDVKKPYLYFVDLGLPATHRAATCSTWRSCRSSTDPSRSRRRGSNVGQTASRPGSPTGRQPRHLARPVPGPRRPTASAATRAAARTRRWASGCDGESDRLQRQRLARGVVAHGAPYVTPNKAGRSEGCPAMEPGRAQKLLPSWPMAQSSSCSRRTRTGCRAIPG